MLWWLAENTILGAILAGLVALICRCFRPGPAVRHALWLVVLLKLLTPPLVHWPWPTPDLWATLTQSSIDDSASGNSGDPKTESPVTDSYVPTRDTEVAFVLVEIESALPDAESERFDLARADSPAPADPPQGTPTLEPSDDGGWRRWLPPAHQVMQVWLVGAAAMGAWQLLRILRFVRLLAGAKAAPGSLANLVEELAGRLGVRAPATLLLPGIGSPFVWSLGWTKLLWPAELQLADDCRRSVLLHELAHLRRRDHWVGWLQLLGGCIWWWNPLFWLVCRQLRENAELACDAWVVQLLPEARRAYAEALIQVTQNISQRAAPVAAFGLGNGRRREFERRLTMIMKECVPCRVPVRALVVIGLLALAVLPGWTLGQQAPEKPAQAVPPPPVAKTDQPTPPPVVAPAPVPEQPTPPLLVGPAPAGVPPLIQEVPPRIYYKPVTRDGVTFYQAVPTEGDQGGDRLEQIEKQLQALLNEVQVMRKGGKGDGVSKSAPKPQGTRVILRRNGQISADQITVEGNPPQTSAGSGRSQGGEVTLTRASYNLPTAKGEALAALLKDVKNEVIETKVEGDKVTVTSSPEAQQMIAQFIALLNGQKGPRAYYQYVPRTAYQAEPATRR